MPAEAHTQIAQLRRIHLKNIFVGNLSFNTSEDELRQLFAAYGAVDRVSIMKDRDTGQPRGFAFVEMASAADGEKAIAELNGTLLGDRALNVSEARPRPERVSGGPGRSGPSPKRRTLVTRGEAPSAYCLNDDAQLCVATTGHRLLHDHCEIVEVDREPAKRQDLGNG